LVTSADAVNRFTSDFANTNSNSVTVTVATTVNGAHHASGTPPGVYTVTVNSFTESSSDATVPSSSGGFDLTVN
jgi:hypothetical protein